MFHGTRKPHVAVRSLRMVFFSLATLSASAGFAQAQWFPYRYQPPVVYEELTPGEVAHIIARQGYRTLSRPSYFDDFIAVNAIDPEGRRTRLILDVYSGRIVASRPFAPPRRVDRPRKEQRERTVQRAPGQGGAIRDGAPKPAESTKATPERPSIIKREPLLPPQGNAPAPSRKDLVAPSTPAKPVKPPQASVGAGTKDAPRRIQIGPPAELDAPAAKSKAPQEAPINSVPPAALE